MKERNYIENKGFFFPMREFFLYILMNIESMEASYQSPVIGRISIGQMDKDVKKQSRRILCPILWIRDLIPIDNVSSFI